MIPYLAIDPGLKGGFAWRDTESNYHCQEMPDTEGGVADRLRSLSASGVWCAYIEDVGGWGMPGPRAFTFGRGFGVLIGSLMTLGCKIVLVRPAKWQKHLSLGTIKTSGGKSAWKKKLISEAQRRFPSLEVTAETADALLILEYAGSIPHENL